MDKNDKYFLIMFGLSILTIVLICWQFYNGKEIEALFNMIRAVFVMEIAIFAEVIHQKRR